MNDARMLYQMLQQLEFHRRKLDRLAIAGHLGAFEIDGHLSESKRIRSTSVTVHRRSAEKGLNACEQLDHLERLCQVIVGAQLQTEHLVDRFTLCGEH